MSGCALSVSLSDTKRILKGIVKATDWATLCHPESSSFYTQVREGTKWIKAWVAPVEAARKFTSLQKIVFKVKVDSLWRRVKVLSRGISCSLAGLSSIQLFNKMQFTAFSAVTTALFKRITLVLKLVGGMVAVALAVRAVFKMYCTKTSGEEDLRQACLCLATRIYSLVFSLIFASTLMGAIS